MVFHPCSSQKPEAGYWGESAPLRYRSRPGWLVCQAPFWSFAVYTRNCSPPLMETKSHLSLPSSDPLRSRIR